MDKKFSIYLLVLLSLCFVGLLAYRLHPIGKRLDILLDYRQLLSDPDAAERLAFVPEIKHWSSVWPKDSISVGYASFAFPFGEIQHISETPQHVCIDSDQAEVKLVLYLLDDFSVCRGLLSNQLPGLTYAGGSVQMREEKYRKHDTALLEIKSGVPSYEFHKTVVALTPKPLLSLLFVDFDYLYLYEKLLEIKNSELWRGHVFLFETDTLKGMVERQDWLEAEHDYSSCYLISVWDSENKIYQLIQVMSNTDDITEQEIQQFVSSLSYQMYVIDSNSEDLRPIILDALEQNAYYVQP